MPRGSMGAARGEQHRSCIFGLVLLNPRFQPSEEEPISARGQEPEPQADTLKQRQVGQVLAGPSIWL